MGKKPLASISAQPRTKSVRSNDPSGAASRASVIQQITSPLALYGLIVLVSEAVLGASLTFVPATSRTTVIIVMVCLMALVVLSVIAIAWLRPELLTVRLLKIAELPEEKKRTILNENKAVVKDADAPPLSPDIWLQELQQLRPVLHQAAWYSMPTYFLDAKLNIIDWNPAFELIFKPILKKIRRQHVNHFIIELANWDRVFDHARDFTEHVSNGELPLVDMEPLIFNSESYGVVEFEKIAAQLTDRDATLKSWAVGLMITNIDWASFNRDLLQRLHEHKRWSIYAVSYDAVLHMFPPYLDLIEEVIQGIPAGARHVLDIGAGTGNVTAALLGRGHKVTALENSQAMLEKLLAKRLAGQLSILRNSVEEMESLESESFDAVSAVNVLYALDDPAACISNIARILKPGGTFVFSTTHSETDLDPLLTSIRNTLKRKGRFEALEEHFDRLYSVNKDIEVRIARRYTRQEYEDWVNQAGFEIVYNNPDSYEKAVMVIRCRKISPQPSY